MTIAEWFSTLERSERKGVLSDLHDNLRVLKNTPATNVKSLEKVLSRLEDEHEKLKEHE